MIILIECTSSSKGLFCMPLCRSLYELDFMQVKPARGFYNIGLSVEPAKPDSRLLGTSGAEVNHFLREICINCKSYC